MWTKGQLPAARPSQKGIHAQERFADWAPARTPTHPVPFSVNPQAVQRGPPDLQDCPSGRLLRRWLWVCRSCPETATWARAWHSPVHTLQATRAAVPCKFGLGPRRPRRPPTLSSPLRLRLALRSYRVAITSGSPRCSKCLGAWRGSPPWRSLRLAAEGLRQDASRAWPRPPGCCSEARGRPLPGPRAELLPPSCQPGGLPASLGGSLLATLQPPPASWGAAPGTRRLCFG